MIRYSDYSGPQNDVAVRDGEVVPFDEDAARAMAQHAHMLAADVPEQAVVASASDQPSAALA